MEHILAYCFPRKRIRNIFETIVGEATDVGSRIDLISYEDDVGGGGGGSLKISRKRKKEKKKKE